MIDLFCYAILNGALVDLTSMCQPPSPAAVQPAPTPAKQLRVSDLTIGEDGRFYGRVTNQTSETVRFVKVFYEVIGENDRLIESGSVYTQPATIAPGETVNFSWFTNTENFKTIRITYTEWR